MADVSIQLNDIRNTYGGSDLQTLHIMLRHVRCKLSSSSNSIQNATGIVVTTVPYKLVLEDSVGLFGAENYYMKITLDIQDSGNSFTTVNSYTDLTTSTDTALVNTYLEAVEDPLSDLTTVDTYEPSNRGTGFQELIEPMISVALNNIGTGNRYNDAHIDARLYDKNFREIAEYDALANKQTVIYLGVHCRNTRRIPYNIEINIGETVTLKSELSEIARRTILP